MKNSEEVAAALYAENEKLVEYWIKRLYGNALPSNVHDELYSAGSLALYQAAENYDPENEAGAKFNTFASAHIKLSFIKVWEKNGKHEKAFDDTVKPPKPDEFLQEEKKQGERLGKKEPDRLALQVLEVLRMWSDEKHSLTQQDVMDWQYAYAYEKFGFTDQYDRRKFSQILKNLMLEMNPDGSAGEGAGGPRILSEDNDANKLTGLSLVHLFSYSEMDKLIEAVCFSDMLTGEEKATLIKKIFSTASEYYRSPFWDKAGQKILFNPKVVHGRLSKKFGGRSLAENNGIVQKAIAGKNVISFKFNHYTKDMELEPNKDKNGEDRIYTLRPYHLVVYHDNYYCLGFHEGSDNVYHYRVDLMSNIELVLDEKGKPVRKKTIPAKDYKFVGDFWDPETYMAEHIYMAYGDPRDIKIKIDNHDKKGFTFLHDWFGEHFKVVRAPKDADPDYIFVSVKADPKMIVHWAMQYSGLVEVMDDEGRGLIKEELERMREKYE